MFLLTTQRLLILRGPDHHGKAELARHLAGGLPGKTVAIHFSDLCDRWIVQHAEDLTAESDLCYRLLKLTAISYLKDGYSVVVDAPYAEMHGSARIRTDDARDLARLSRTFRGIRATVVTLFGAALDGEAGALAAEMRRDHIDGEIVVEGEGGDVEQAAAQILERIETL